jgi:hypothetical protein
MKLSLTSSWVSEQKQTLAVACEGRVLCSPIISSLAPVEAIPSFPSRSFVPLIAEDFKPKSEVWRRHHSGHLLNFPEKVMKQHVIGCTQMGKPYFAAIRAAIWNSIEPFERYIHPAVTARTFKFKTIDVLNFNQNSLFCGQIASMVTL